MKEKWSQDEVGAVILGRKILKAKGLSRDADVKAICEAAGISRKTGYQWADKLKEVDEGERRGVEEELARLKAEHEDLQRRYEDLRFENEGRKVAWRVHGVDELIRGKKNTTPSRRKRKR
jgi:hypothetical protein